MRWLSLATTVFFTTSPQVSHSLAFVPSSSRRFLLTTLLSSSTIFASAEEGECSNETVVTPPLSEMYDSEYPGTAVQRLKAVHERVKVIANDGSLNGKWEDVRRHILWAGGLKDLPNSAPTRTPK